MAQILILPFDSTAARQFDLLREAKDARSDEIDRVLARHYGVTDEELDFIINYDIKYRMGDALKVADESG